jgi:hypothetical protein
MEAHPTLFGVQMAATACLYNLTKGELAQKIHPKILKQVVELTLTAMENFPNHYQVGSVFDLTATQKICKAASEDNEHLVGHVNGSSDH